MAMAIAAGGIRIIEIAFTTPKAASAIERLADHEDGLLIGAGTILDESSAAAAIAAGARFLVSPGLFPDVIQTGNRNGVPTLPGVSTVTEAVAALEAGADMLKLFPASVLGTGFLSAVRPVLPHVAFVPTGGINVTNAGDWLDAGAVAVGVGGALTAGTPADVTERARSLVASLPKTGT